MDSWKSFSEEKGFWLSEEVEFTYDGQRNCKDQAIGSKIKPYFNVENCPLVSNTQALERLEIVDMGFSNEIRKSYSISSEPSGEVFSDEIGTDSYGNVVSSLCEEKEMGSRVSSDFMASKNQDCSLIDLNLGRVVDGVGAKIGEFPSPSNNASYVVAKRSRLTNSYPLSPCCQVFGCNKDLSTSKGYYKRHKVCELHTKTAKVVVDGIEQRFCQQCSRFHLLAEFDDGKRSCRRRLAAHNKRRRKPQITSESGSRVISFSSPFGFSQLFPSSLCGSGEEIGNLVPSSQQMSCALSLLSAKSHSMSNLLGSSTNTPELCSMETFHGETSLTHPCDANTIEVPLPSDAIPRGPYLGDDGADNHHDPVGRGIVLDLLQLSSHLQRIEQQRHSEQSEAG